MKMQKWENKPVENHHECVNDSGDQYRWNSPQEWLREKIKEWTGPDLETALADIIPMLNPDDIQAALVDEMDQNPKFKAALGDIISSMLNPDDIQYMFQDEMDQDSYEGE